MKIIYSIHVLPLNPIRFRFDKSDLSILADFPVCVFEPVARRGCLAKIYNWHVDIDLQVCGKAWSCAAELARHGKCHLGGTMFTCHVCFHVFANAASLERHAKRHAADKPYACAVCGKSFVRKEHLDNHTRWVGINTISCSPSKYLLLYYIAVFFI